MDKLHERSPINSGILAPQDGQRGLSCGDTEHPSCPLLGVPPPLSKDTLNALEELGDVLRCIHKRMACEGYEIMDGVVRKIDISKNI